MRIRPWLGTLERRATRHLRRLLHRAAAVIPKSRFRSHPFGVTVVGHPDASHSLGVVTRNLCAALTAAEIPYDLISIDRLSYHRGHSSLDATTRKRSRPRFAFTIITAWPDHMDLEVISPLAFAGRHVIGQWLCEQSELTEGFITGLELVDEVWAGSSFAAETFAHSTAKPVTQIPLIVHRPANHSNLGTRTRFAIPSDRLVFLTIATVGSSMLRKNPTGTLHAFRMAFPLGQTEAVLVVKLRISDHLPSQQRKAVDDFLNDDAFGPDVILMDREFSDEEVTELLQSCDCFVSLHRAEGFGLGAAEAMSLGKPVIVTNWSGPVDYLTTDNAFPVPYELTPIHEHDAAHFVRGLDWAEPDLTAAAAFMRSIVDDPAHAATLGARAALDIPLHHSAGVVGAMMAERLHQLHDR